MKILPVGAPLFHA